MASLGYPSPTTAFSTRNLIFRPSGAIGLHAVHCITPGNGLHNIRGPTRPTLPVPSAAHVRIP